MICTSFVTYAQHNTTPSELEQSLRKLSMAHLAISNLYVDSVDPDNGSDAGPVRGRRKPAEIRFGQLGSGLHHKLAPGGF